MWRASKQQTGVGVLRSHPWHAAGWVTVVDTFSAPCYISSEHLWFQLLGQFWGVCLVRDFSYLPFCSLTVLVSSYTFSEVLAGKTLITWGDNFNNSQYWLLFLSPLPTPSLLLPKLTNKHLHPSPCSQENPNQDTGFLLSRPQFPCQ